MMLGVSLAIFAADDPERADWREELLAAEGIGTSVEELRAALSREKEVPTEWEKALQKLTSSKFLEREAGQRRLIAGGEAALKWLQQMETSDDPELRRRVLEVI